MSATSTETVESLTVLEARLPWAQERLTRATAALGRKHQGGEIEEYRAAYAALLTLQRSVAAARGEEYAETFDLGVRWCTGAPLPYLIVNDQKTLLTFLVDEPDPNWDGTSVTVKLPSDGRPQPLALVEFIQCHAAKLGHPNDEVFEGHRLHGRGSERYKPQIVRNSKWLAESEKNASIHRQHDPRKWRNLNHYIFWFHDSTFECIAASYKLEVFHESLPVLLARGCQRMIS